MTSPQQHRRPHATGTHTAGNVGASVEQWYSTVRRATEMLCAPLAVEDYGVQTTPDVSPPKWHLAHVSWFFEAFVLQPFLRDYQAFHPRFHYLFNSYYHTAGAMHPRAQRGLLSRPTVETVYAYRRHVDEHMSALFASCPEKHRREMTRRTVLGCHHEQQHQELLLTDIKHIFATNPLRPAYLSATPNFQGEACAAKWFAFGEGVSEIGFAGDGFCFDNETPRHRIFIQPFRLLNRCVTSGEYLEFIAAGGYERVELWLSDAWHTVKAERWQAPLYWEKIDAQWWEMTLHGMRPVDENAPVCHVSFYEADAYARWRGKSLPTEAAWEIVAREKPVEGNFADSGALRPLASCAEQGAPQQLFGDVWEWTKSAYAPYPGFQPLAGTLGEYNGKFMCNQMVLRGGSCATPAGHVRPTYRNFFYPKDRWQFSGIRLAEELQ